MEMIKENTLAIVHNSYGRCLANGNVIETFYKKFLSSSPKVAERFKNTDFNEQNKLLKHGLNLMIMYSRGNFAGQAGLKRIKETHSRTKLDIEPHFYQLWKAALLKTIPLHDQKYDPTVEEAWDKVLEMGIQYIKQRY